MSAEQRGELLARIMAQGLREAVDVEGEPEPVLVLEVGHKTDVPPAGPAEPEQGPGRGIGAVMAPARPSQPAGGRGAGVTGKSAELLAELQLGGELVEVGNKVGVERGGDIVATFLGVTGAALEMRGLLVKVGPGRWALRKAERSEAGS